MGVALRDIIVAEEITLDSLNNKVLAIDTFNMLYQFLTTIRGADGTPLMDSKGNVTSHLVGLFSRTTKFMEAGLKPVFVFDGKAPDLKLKERERRAQLKSDAKQKYETAKQQENIEEMKKYAGRTSRLTSEMVAEAKQLIEALGLPVIQAPSEGEAQAAHIARNGDAYAVVSQDFDSLMHGAPRIVRNLSLAGKKKTTNKLSYEKINPEQILLSENLKAMELTPDQLIALSMLVGTDYNIGGVKGIGPKNALKLVKKHGENFDALFDEAKWPESCQTPWVEIYNTIKHIPVSSDYKIIFTEPNLDKIREILVDNHDFSNERIERVEQLFNNMKKEKKQKGLAEFF